ncbi:expressed unknown protein [Seminavis robusta]|uniref:Uncharacterized protein n=1 Tax=Seminavis robusta TaxID=568900 RepID=A0A9N8D7M1_9STRA|nr:expressed unknown protein [Seminavis robusta]|eukprot:Sro27_g018400.1 n/a (216) ;mRNA; r:147424-148071
MRDHSETAKKLARLRGVDDDINQLVNMGFVSSDGSETQFHSLSHSNRSAAIIFRGNSVPEAVLVPDPHHDSNKLYGVIRALPKGQVFHFQLEDLGIEEKDCRVGDEKKSLQSDEPSLLSPQQCVGGVWLDELVKGKEWPSWSRVAFAASIAGSSTFAVVALDPQQLFATPSSRVSIAEVVKLLGDVDHLFTMADMIVPVVMPRRIASSVEVKFHG